MCPKYCVFLVQKIVMISFVFYCHFVKTFFYFFNVYPECLGNMMVFHISKADKIVLVKDHISFVIVSKLSKPHTHTSKRVQYITSGLFFLCEWRHIYLSVPISFSAHFFMHYSWCNFSVVVIFALYQNTQVFELIPLVKMLIILLFDSALCFSQFCFLQFLTLK